MNRWEANIQLKGSQGSRRLSIVIVGHLPWDRQYPSWTNPGRLALLLGTRNQGAMCHSSGVFGGAVPTEQLRRVCGVFGIHQSLRQHDLHQPDEAANG